MIRDHAFLHYEVKWLKELAELVDSRISDIYRLADEIKMPDEYGLLDSLEHVSGFGFVGFQTFIVSVASYMALNKLDIIELGPFHSSGTSKIKMIHHAANFWKHKNEWDFEKTDRRRRIIEDAFKSIGVPVDTDYPLYHTLHEISAPMDASFLQIFNELQSWLDLVDKLQEIENGKRGNE